LPRKRLTNLAMTQAGFIHYFTEDITFRLIQPQITAAWIQEVIHQEGYELGYINFIFCSDAFLHTKNLQYLQHDTLTDILTFDYAESPKAIEGDIYISIERVQDNAATYQHQFEQELYTVMIHGVLHLLGYLDQSPTDTAIMRQKEALYVASRLEKA
jgi:probable rRNA maturation factor